MSSNAAGNWCLIESDPGVFTELLRGFGVTGVQVEELYSLDDETFFAQMRPIYGLIFLFKWRPEEATDGELMMDTPGVYFAQQVISNACASQALINLVLNAAASANPSAEAVVGDNQISLGKTLEEFRAFTQAFDPATRGLSLSNCEEIRKLHNSFARENYLELDVPKRGPKEDNFHFVTYVPVAGRVWELDGLREAPISVGPVQEGQDWLDVVRPHIRKRIERYQTGEIHFNLMAVVGDQKAAAERQLVTLIEKGMETTEAQDEMAQLQATIASEEEKMQRYRVENNRRRHNYLPFIVELLKCLAREGKLVPLVREAVEKQKEKTAAEKKAGANSKA